MTGLKTARLSDVLIDLVLNKHQVLMMIYYSCECVLPEGNRNVQFIDPNQYAILLILDMNRTSEMDIFMKLVARSICNLVNIADKVNNVLVKSVNIVD